MSSAARLAANRANALLSTGPATAAGKQNSSLNALQHGLTSQKLILPGESQEEYDRFRAALHSDMKPAGALEEVLFDRVVQSCWRLQRFYRIETAFFANRAAAIQQEQPGIGSPDDALAMLFIDEKQMKRMNLFLRYQAATERAYNKALADFRAAQTERRKQKRDQSMLESFVKISATSEPPSLVTFRRKMMFF
jgi:hypothetical protein